MIPLQLSWGVGQTSTVPLSHHVLRLDSADAARIRAAFPSRFASDIDRVLAGTPDAEHPTSASDIGAVAVDGETIAIPTRIYSPPPAEADLARLTATQRLLLGCAYTRHHDGHLREASVRQIIGSDASFVTPFVIQLLGEYVLEIVEFIHEQRGWIEAAVTRGFVQANPTFLALTRQRAMSYWDCYFRHRWPKRAAYPAIRVLDALHGLANDASGRPLSERGS